MSFSILLDTSPCAIISHPPLAWIVKEINSHSPFPTVIIDATNKISINATVIQLTNKESLAKFSFELNQILPNRPRTIIAFGINSLLSDISEIEENKFLNLRIFSFFLKSLIQTSKRRNKVILLHPSYEDRIAYLQLIDYYFPIIYTLQNNEIVPFEK